jgi:UDP-N-acetylglucosamine 2-epimerase (non-hydrolysing)
LKKIKVLSILGTRPEAVKMAPVIRLLDQTDEVESVILSTGQHREMLDQVFQLFSISPDFDLKIMRTDQDLPDLTAEVLKQVTPLIRQIKPDWVLVQGDTTTVFAASLAAFYERIRVGHIEAGLRTFNKWQPFPEEINRRIASVLTDLHFSPTVRARENLLREGIPDWRITLTGNPVIDAIQSILNNPTPDNVLSLIKDNGIRKGVRELILVTAHRRENFGQNIENICTALKSLGERYQDRVHILYPVHLNPNIQEPVHRRLSGIPNITLIDPVDYLSMVHLMQQAKLVLTDSGGIQEEATALRKPTLVLRSVTERPEGVEAGILKLVGTDADKIVAETSRLMDDELLIQKMTSAENPFGDGHAAERIVQALIGFTEPGSK